MISDYALAGVIAHFDLVLMGWAAFHVPGQDDLFTCVPGSIMRH